ncbi:MAG TPA: type II secretion system minor pseudopilin GspK, partial [bacterium]|nr:type II secretion system minor pseudopilin GspK [bacterium]
SKRGIVLVFTMGFILALVSLALEFHRVCQRRMETIRTQVDKVRSELLARTGIALAREILKTDRNGYDWLGENWHQEKLFKINGEEIKLVIQDEDGKVNLNGILQAEGKVNTQLKDLTERLFLVLGLSGNLLDCLLDWVDEDEMPRVFGAESMYYRTLAPPYQAANRSLLFLKELSLIKGFTKDVLKGDQERPGLMDLVTLASDSKINVNTCDPIILKAMGFSEIEVNELVAQRETGPLEETYLMRVNRNVFLANRGLVAYRSNYFSVTVEVRVNTAPVVKKRALLKKGDEVAIIGVETL